MVGEARNPDEVERPLTDGLVGDTELAAAGVSRLGQIHTWSVRESRSQRKPPLGSCAAFAPGRKGRTSGDIPNAGPGSSSGPTQPQPSAFGRLRRAIRQSAS